VGSFHISESFTWNLSDDDLHLPPQMCVYMDSAFKGVFVWLYSVKFIESFLYYWCGFSNNSFM